MYLNKYYSLTILSLVIAFIITLFLDIDINYAIDSALVLSKKIIYPNNFNVWSDFIYNSWSLINQLSALFLKIDLNIFIVTKILTFLNVWFLSLGIILIGYALSSSIFLSFLITIFHIVFRFNIGSTDYPVLYFSDHIWGEIANSLFILIIGLVFNGLFKLLGFFSMVLIACHVVIGFWNLFLILFLFLIKKFLKQKIILNNLKNFIEGSVYGLVVTIISLGFYFYLKQGNLYKFDGVYDLGLYKIFIDYWDGHRSGDNLWFKFHIKLLFSAILIIIFFKINEKKISQNLVNGFLLVSSGIVISIIIFALVKLLKNYFPFIMIPMLNRFTALYSILIFPLLLFVLIFYFLRISKSYLNEKNLNNFYLVFFLIFLFFYLMFGINSQKVIYLKNIFLKNYKIIINASSNNYIEEQIFWEVIKKEKTTGVFLGNFEGSLLISRMAFKPIFFDTTIQFNSYNPKYLKYSSKFFKEIFLVDIKKPQEETKYRGRIVNTLIKKSFESHSPQDWLIISKKYNIAGIIVPNQWKINLTTKIYYGKIYKLYLF